MGQTHLGSLDDSVGHLKCDRTRKRDRIQEAKLNGWLGEVAGLDASIQAAVRKLDSLDRMRDRQRGGPVNLGIPVIADPR